MFQQVIQTKEVGGNPDYYSNPTTTTLYVLKSFSGLISSLCIKNDSTTDTVQFSWDGATLAGDVKPSETIEIKTDQRTGIYIKATTGGGLVRIWGWVGV